MITDNSQIEQINTEIYAPQGEGMVQEAVLVPCVIQWFDQIQKAFNYPEMMFIHLIVHVPSVV